jgi:hypothetical protein
MVTPLMRSNIGKEVDSKGKIPSALQELLDTVLVMGIICNINKCLPCSKVRKWD